MLAGGRPVRISDDARAALARFRAQGRTVRYARLARDMELWGTEASGGEQALGPDDVEPFLSKDIDPLLGEAA